MLHSKTITDDELKEYVSIRISEGATASEIRKELETLLDTFVSLRWTADLMRAVGYKFLT